MNKHLKHLKLIGKNISPSGPVFSYKISQIFARNICENLLHVAAIYFIIKCHY